MWAAATQPREEGLSAVAAGVWLAVGAEGLCELAVEVAGVGGDGGVCGRACRGGS